MNAYCDDCGHESGDPTKEMQSMTLGTTGWKCRNREACLQRQSKSKTTKKERAMMTFCDAVHSLAQSAIAHGFSLEEMLKMACVATVEAADQGKHLNTMSVAFTFKGSVHLLNIEAKIHA